MEAWIRRARYVLVVCTEIYRRRVEGEEEPGKGRGAKWEGALITQHLYDNDGRNDRFLPVVFSPDDVRCIPTFLAAATYYDVSTESGYIKLYRRLTSQPAVVRPPLGSVHTLPPDSAEASLGPNVERPSSPHSKDFLQSLVVIEGPGGHAILPARSVARSRHLTLELLPQTAQEAAFLAQVRDSPGSTLGVAYGTTAAFGRMETVEQHREGPKEVWTIVLQPEEADLSPGGMEMAYNGYSADKLAELRARRILLNDPAPLRDDAITDLNDAALEMFIRRNGGPGEIKQSPLPALYGTYHEDPALFEAVAKLFVLLFMRAGAVVQHVHELEIKLQSQARATVHFVGQRHRVFSNREPPIIRVDGALTLEAPGRA
jgi:hypothetical protein